jgi:hypothetical protein
MKATSVVYDRWYIHLFTTGVQSVKRLILVAGNLRG